MVAKNLSWIFAMLLLVATVSAIAPYPEPPANLTEAKILRYMNTTTDGWYINAWSFISIAWYLLVLFLFIRNGIWIALAMAGIMSTFTGVLLWSMLLIPDAIVMIIGILTILSIVGLYLDKKTQ